MLGSTEMHVGHSRRDLAWMLSNAPRNSVTDRRRARGKVKRTIPVVNNAHDIDLHRQCYSVKRQWNSAINHTACTTSSEVIDSACVQLHGTGPVIVIFRTKTVEIGTDCVQAQSSSVPTSTRLEVSATPTTWRRECYMYPDTQ